MELARWLATLHPKLVQFPLVLLLAGLVFDLVGLLARKESFHWAAKRLTAAGTVIMLIAFICGIYAEVWAGRAGIPQHPIEWHEFLANVSSWGFVLLAAWRIFLSSRQRAAMGAYVIVGLTFYVLLALTAYLGGKLVFDYGAAVTAQNNGSGILSLHDLNTLATRQTDENLKYSEMMHHIFGWLVLALSGSLLAQALFPKRAEKVRWVGPTLLLLGGIFLFFFADLDLYPHFLDPRQLRDREVQLHKTIAIILTVTGIVGLKRKKKELAAPSPPAAGQSKLVAVLALIGGGLLFTHVHTVAPYANVAAGVYIAHVTLGLVALAIGATRLMQDRWPSYRQGLVIGFAVLMCIESILLITYNEGLPWYIGYGHYLRTGRPADGYSVIAPYGPLRAELTFDERSQRFDVYTLKRFSNDPDPIPAEKLNILISRGYEEIAVPVDATNPVDGAASHFTGPAEALKNIEAFSARLAVPVHGSMRMGYFDPWVTPIIAAIPPNEVAKYVCPMHDAMRSEQPGNCPLCGMPMIPYSTIRPTTLHDADYAMAFSATGQGRSRHLSFTPQFQGKTLRDLAVTHTKLLHLIIVSSDLQRFEHVHPILQPDGSFQLDHTFPADGSYLLFADITPNAHRSQVFREQVQIGSGAAEPAHLSASPAGAAILADDPHMVAQMITSPRDLSAGIESYLLFRLSVDGQPLTDLEPYLGAMGHCVVISEDGQSYLHSHPEQLFNPSPDAHGGPAVMFHTIFPHAGTYKIWGQFQRHGKVFVASFIVKVGHPWLPPRMINFILND